MVLFRTIRARFHIALYLYTHTHTHTHTTWWFSVILGISVKCHHISVSYTVSFPCLDKCAQIGLWLVKQAARCMPIIISFVSGCSPGIRGPKSDQRGSACSPCGIRQMTAAINKLFSVFAPQLCDARGAAGAHGPAVQPRPAWSLRWVSPALAKCVCAACESTVISHNALHWPDLYLQCDL